MPNLEVLFLKLPRNTEVTPEAAQTFLSALTQVNFVPRLKKLFGQKPPRLALEIVLINQRIQFQIVCSPEISIFVETQIRSSYPLVIIEKVSDPALTSSLEVSELGLKQGSYYPLATYSSFRDTDPLSSVLSVLSKGNPEEISIVQFALEGTDSSWQSSGTAYAEKGSQNADGTYRPRSDQNVIKDKISFPGFKTTVRIASNVKGTINELKSAFGVYTRADGNSFSSKGSLFRNQKTKYLDLIARKVGGGDILNVAELATVWHLPSSQIKTLSIAWGTSVLTEPPEKLPIALTTDEEKKTVNFFAKTLFRNKETIFGIKDIDRRRHVWNIGKTGTGKSTLIANMAIDDLKKGRGLAVIDPHGDLSEVLLDYIPASRINDVIYFNPGDRNYPIFINPLEVTNKEEAELVVSGIISIFNKIFGFSWGPRLEYILRNCLFTLTEIPDSTLVDVLSLLSDRSFRTKVIAKIKDPSLKQFWSQEYEKMPEKLQKEAISPIQNKVGQFVTSPLIRNVIGHPKSSIKIDEIMDQGKILIANLSQGRLGEDNASLLGAMLITKIQLAAMRRVDQPEASRRDFYLYVDEFQNFATTSFIKILSEARKYRLCLMLANQYMAQIPEDVQSAILGNAGSLISFAVGASDARILFREFAEVFSENDLVNLSNYQIAIRLMIDGFGERPFLATTLPLPASSNQNREKVIRVSRERWGKKTT